MRKVIWVIVMLCTFAFANSQTTDKKLLDAMNFAAKSGWSVSLKRFDASIQLDSTAFYKGKYPMQIKQSYIAGISPVLRGVLYNNFFLPSINSDSLTISLTCKSQNLKSAYLIIAGISRNEKLLYSDTLSVNNHNEWSTFQKKVPLCDVAMMELAIEFEGVDTLRFSETKDDKIVSLQNLWLDRIEMKVGDEMLTDNAMPSYANVPLLQKNVVVIDSLLSSAFDIPFKAKKIVAFGESVHGSATINEKVVQLLKHGIKYDNRRLILIELPLEKMIYVNRFIHGDGAFHIDSIKPYFEQSLYSYLWIDFFTWLKEYNAQAKDKVWFLGIDYEFEHWFTELDIFEYLVAINRTVCNPDITEFCRMLVTTKKNLKEKLSFFQSHDCFRSELGLQESKIVEHCFQSIIQARSHLASNVTLRDNMMFNNLQFLFNLFSENAVMRTYIYSHFGHANYSSLETKTISDPPFGFLAKQAFGDEYFTVGIFAGGGETLNSGKGKKLEVSHLRANSANTFEYWLDQVLGDDFYVPKIFLPSYLMCFRNIGNSTTEFTRLMNPSCRMDGALYIRESKPLKKASLEIDTERFRFINRYKKCLDESRKIDFGKNLKVELKKD